LSIADFAILAPDAGALLNDPRNHTNGYEQETAFTGLPARNRIGIKQSGALCRTDRTQMKF